MCPGGLLYYSGSMSPTSATGLVSSSGRPFTPAETDQNSCTYALYGPYTTTQPTTWYSNNTSVATVDNSGTVTFVGPGSTSITGTWQAIVGRGSSGDTCAAIWAQAGNGSGTVQVKPAVGSLQASAPSTQNPNGGGPSAGTKTTSNTSTAFATTSTTDMISVLQSGNVQITISALGVTPASAAGQLRWKIDRDPSDTVTTGTPTLDTQVGSQVKVTPNVAGNFRLICYSDLNGNSVWDSGEELKVFLIAIVRTTVDSADSTIDSGVVFHGAQVGLTTSTTMMMNFEVLLEGGGANRLIGVSFIHTGDVGNLTADNSTINYPIPNPTPAAPGNVAGTETENPGGTLPMLDGPNDNPTGGTTAFRSHSNETLASGPGGKGQVNSLGSDDFPSFGPWDNLHPVTHNPWLTTQGGYNFTEFIVAFSDSFPLNYDVLAKATWTINAVGSKVGGIWTNSGSSGMTLQGSSQPSAPFTLLVANGSPTSGTTAAVQVLGLSYALHHTYNHTP
jgi:hypothetical protein